MSPEAKNAAGKEREAVKAHGELSRIWCRLELYPLSKSSEQ
jgi:hypothetical protein